MPSWTWAPNNWWAFVPSLNNAITFDLERGLLCLITPAGAMQPYIQDSMPITPTQIIGYDVVG